MKSRRYHRGIGRSPYEAMFGKEMKIGLENEHKEGEFELEEDEENSQDVEKIIDWSESVKKASSSDPEYFPSDDSEIDEGIIEELDQREKSVSRERIDAKKFQESQASKMAEASKKRFGHVDVGTTVRIPVSDVDRPKLGHTHIFGVVREESEGFYSLGTKAGILPQKFFRNQFEPCENNFLSTNDVPDAECPFRAAVGKESVTGTQGHKHCTCISGCKTKKCVCKNLAMLCNSRCHQSNPCNNK